MEPLVDDVALTHEDFKNAIEILKRSQQTLVFLDSLICPIRELIGSSRDDIKMIKLKNLLEQHGIIDNALGFWSLASCKTEGCSPKGHIHFTSFSLNEEWFKKNCNTHRFDEETKQFKLF